MPTRRVVASTLALVTAAGTVAATAATAASGGASTGTRWVATATKAVRFAGSTDLGRAAPGTPLHLALGLAPRDVAGAARLLRQMYTPGSQSYHRFLTPAGYLQRFAPTDAQVGAVTAYLSRAGFVHVSAASNHLLVTADGTVAQAQRAFHTSLHGFLVAGRRVVGNVTPASVPSTLAGTVDTVIGLSTLPLPTPHPLTHTASARPSGAARAAAAGNPDPFVEMAPKKFRTTYHAAGTPSGSRTAIAIFTEGDQTQVIKDLRYAEEKQHLPRVRLTQINVGPQSKDTAGQDEFDMDTQVSTAMATTVRRLYLYNVASLVDSNIVEDFNAFVAQDRARAMSASIGGCDIGPYLDGSQLTTDILMQEGAMQGQTLFASSGDNGAGCAFIVATGVPSSFPGTNWPASGEFTTAVGGTSLLVDSNGNRVQEVGWVGSGGGVSEVENPGWWEYDANPAQAAEYVTGGRAVPDISLDADPNFFTAALVYVSKQATGVGGTSLSSPLMLGAWARLQSAHRNRLGMASIDLWNLYDAVNKPTVDTGLEAVPALPPAAVKAFTDIVLGDNGPYAAYPGFDYVTGLGAPDIAALAKSLR